MTTREPFLEAIVKAPDDDALRLVFADWLDENGDPDRAEFIRVQSALHSNAMPDDQRTELRHREQQLLEQNGWDWAAEEFGQEISEWVFERGFIERVAMCLETSKDNILSVLQKAPIRHVRDCGQFCELAGFVEALPHLDHLTGLEFWGLYAFDDKLVRRILESPHLQNLETLILHHDRNGNLVDEQVIVDGILSPHRSNIKELAVNVDCSWRGPSNAIIEAIADSPHLRNLRKLNLSNAGDVGNNPQVTAETIRRLAVSPNLDSLEVLDLRATHATEEVWNAIVEMPQLGQLKKTLFVRCMRGSSRGLDSHCGSSW